MRDLVKSPLDIDIDEAVSVWFVALGIHVLEDLITDLLAAMFKSPCFYFFSSCTDKLDEVPVFHLRLGEIFKFESEDVLVLAKVFGFQAVGGDNILPLEDFVLGLDGSPGQDMSSIQISCW